MLGREVSVLMDENKQAGIHTATFNGDGLASGVYYYRLTTPGHVETRKMALVR
jgi:hypothetical protein